MPIEEAIIRPISQHAFATDELDRLVEALARVSVDPPVSIGIMHLFHRGGAPPPDAHMLVRLHSDSPEPPWGAADEYEDAILAWARAVWEQRQRTRHNADPIMVIVLYDNRADETGWQSDLMQKVILDRPDGQPKPWYGAVGGRSTPRPIPPIWLHGPRKNENQRTA